MHQPPSSVRWIKFLVHSTSNAHWSTLTTLLSTRKVLKITSSTYDWCLNELPMPTYESTSTSVNLSSDRSHSSAISSARMELSQTPPMSKKLRNIQCPNRSRMFVDF